MSAEAITPDRTHAHCRSCDSTELTIFLSLGNLPLSDGLLEPRQLVDNEQLYPLDVAFCANCSLVQILETVPPEELASNDGYLLQYYKDAGVPVLGIDPAPGPVAAAREKGIETLQAFFGNDFAKDLAAKGRRADV